MQVQIDSQDKSKFDLTRVKDDKTSKTTVAEAEEVVPAEIDGTTQRADLKIRNGLINFVISLTAKEDNHVKEKITLQIFELKWKKDSEPNALGFMINHQNARCGTHPRPGLLGAPNSAQRDTCQEKDNKGLSRTAVRCPKTDCKYETPKPKSVVEVTMRVWICL